MKMAPKIKKRVTWGLITAVVVGLMAMIAFAEKANWYAKDKYLHPIIDNRIDTFFTKNCTLPFDKMEILYRYTRDKAKSDSSDAKLFDKIIDEVYSEKDSKVARLK